MSPIKSEFCERLFETIVNHLLLNTLKCDIYVPSQIREAKSGLDALFHSGKKKPLMLQYKVVEQYIKSLSGFKKPSFHFDLHQDKNGHYTQHNLLVNKTKRHNIAGYVVPGFVTYCALYKNYHENTLLDKTYLIMPKQRIGDKHPHSIQYDSDHGYQCSKEKYEVEICSLSEIKQKISNCTEVSKQDFIDTIASIMREEQCVCEWQEDLEKQVDMFLARNHIALLAL